VDKIAFIGSTATAKKVMATCAEPLTPVLAEGGGKDAMIVAADADLDAAADAALWGGLGNAGQTCTGIERVYVASAVADQFLQRLVTGAQKLKVGVDNHATIGPIIMPGQLDTIRRHIADGLADGGRAALGGAEAVQPPYVQPTLVSMGGCSTSALMDGSAVEVMGAVLGAVRGRAGRGLGAVATR
jgi:acyl-CoA reductase-like NAD-dependent aldehyde dehydrogenase